MRFMLEFNRNGRYALTLSALDKKGNSKVLGIAGQGEWTFLPSIATLSQIAIVAMDSLACKCSGVNLSTSHQGKPGGHGTPRRS